MTKLLNVMGLTWKIVYRFHYFFAMKGFWLINLFKPKHRVKSVTDPLLLLSATKLAKMIRQREITSQDIVQAYVKRCMDVNPQINAIVENNFQHALEQAKQIDDMLNSNTAPPPETAPFLGVPVAIKDHFFVDGMLCTAGIPNRHNLRMFEDADVVANMKRAGAIVLCTTNTSEVCMWYECSNSLHGRTCNPYDSRRTAGGSSGGQGALIGAAAAPFGVGSDLAGSIRIPAFFNGIFGHKTSKYVVSQEGVHPCAKGGQRDMYSVGPMCRYAEDLLPMLKVLARPNTHLLSLDTEVDLSQIRIYYMTGLNTTTASPVDKELGNSIDKIIKYFHDKYDVLSYKLDLEYMSWALAVWLTDMDSPGTPSFAKEMTNLDGEIIPVLELLKWTLGLSSHTYPAITFALIEKFLRKMGNAEERKQLKHMKSILSRQMDDLLGSYYVSETKNEDNIVKTKNKVNYNTFESVANDEQKSGNGLGNIEKNGINGSIGRKSMSYDGSSSEDGANDRKSGDNCVKNGFVRKEAVFLFPPHPTLTPYHSQPCLTPFNFQYTAIFSSLGLPVTCCPLGISRQGTPLGVQVVGGLNKDHVTIAMARELEKAFGGWIEP